MGKGIRGESRQMNVYKKVKMLKRRLQRQQLIIHSLEERNIELSSELNQTKMTLSHLSDEYNKLMARNYENNFQFNHKQEELVKLKAYTGNEIMSALKITGNLSEVLLNLKKFLSVPNTSFHTRAESPMITSPSLPNRSDIFSPSSEAKRVQAAVSPMIKGIALKQPTISLRRLNPEEISAFRGESPCRKVTNNVCSMTPIQEEASTPRPPSERIRTRLGSRNQVPPPLSVREESIIRDFIPEAQSEPVVRLSDVSRLLSNTSWVNINYSATSPRTSDANIDDLLTNSDSAPSTSSDISPEKIPISSLGTITVRKRKNVLMSPCENHDDTHGKKSETEMHLLDAAEMQLPTSSEVQLPSSSEVQLPTSSEVHIHTSSEVEIPNSSDVLMLTASSSSSFVEDEQIIEVTNLQRVSSISQLKNSEERKSLGSTLSEKLTIIENTIVNESNQGQQSSDEDDVQQPSTSTLLENTKIRGGKSVRPKSIRVKKPSTRYLDAEVVPNRSPKENIKLKKKSSRPKQSLRRSSGDVSTSTNVENISESRRVSSRSKKTIKYLDEPFSSKEMKRILKKGRQRAEKKSKKN